MTVDFDQLIKDLVKAGAPKTCATGIENAAKAFGLPNVGALTQNVSGLWMDTVLVKVFGVSVDQSMRVSDAGYDNNDLSERTCIAEALIAEFYGLDEEVARPRRRKAA